MSEENQDNPDPESPQQPRDPHGRFTQKSQPESTERSQPRDSDYVKMNSIIAKQLGLTDKLADWQTQYTPQELFSKLEFMSSNLPAETTGNLPSNKKIAPTSATSEKPKLKIDYFNERMEQDSGKGGFHGDISMIDMIQKTNKKK